MLPASTALTLSYITHSSWYSQHQNSPTQNHVSQNHHSATPVRTNNHSDEYTQRQPFKINTPALAYYKTTMIGRSSAIIISILDTLYYWLFNQFRSGEPNTAGLRVQHPCPSETVRIGDPRTTQCECDQTV